MSQMTALLDAVKRGSLDKVRMIVDQHPGLVHERDELGGTALHHATFHGQRDVARFLIEHGADINARDTKFWATPAGWAIEYLREMGGFLGIELEDFGFALERNDVHWVRRFLKRFPNFRHAKDRNGDSFRSLAEHSGNAEIVKLFEEGGQDDQKG